MRAPPTPATARRQAGRRSALGEDVPGRGVERDLTTGAVWRMVERGGDEKTGDADAEEIPVGGLDALDDLIRLRDGDEQ